MAFSKVAKIALFALLLAMVYDRTTAQSGCTSTLLGLSPCLSYVNGNSSTPTASCCSQLSSVVQARPECLCLLLNGTASSYGYNINQTAALTLPGACSVQTPPVSRCNAANAPTASPSTPADSPKASHAQPDIPSGTGSKSVPSTDANHVGGSNIKAPSIALGFILVIASCVLSATGF